MAITFGTEYAYLSASTRHADCVVLDATHIAVVYSKQDGGPYYDGIIRIGTISNDDEITWGDEYTFWDYSTETYSCSYPKVEKLDTNKLVIAWYVPTGSRSVIATVSNGDEVAFGTRSGSGARYFDELDLTVLSTTSFVIAGKDSQNSNYGTASVGTVSGTTISYGSNYIFNSADTDYTALCALDSTHFAVAYEDDGGDDYGCSKIGVITSSTVITFGDEYVFNSGITVYIDTCMIDSTHFVTVYRDAGNSNYGTAIIGTVSNGDEIAYGSEYVYKSDSSSCNSVCVLDSSTLIVSWNTGAKSGTFSGNTITFSTSESSHSSSYIDNALCKISSTYFLNVWSSTTAGKAVIGLYTPIYTLTAELGTFTLTGIASAIGRLLTLTSEVGSFILTGFEASLAKGYAMMCDVGEFTLTGIDNVITKLLNIICSAGLFTLTGINNIMYRIYTLLTIVGEYTLTGITNIMYQIYTLLTTVGEFTLTGVANTFQVIRKLVANVGSFILTGIDIFIHGRGDWRWINQTKHTTSWTEQNKHTTDWTHQNKNTTSWTHINKSN